MSTSLQLWQSWFSRRFKRCSPAKGRKTHFDLLHLQQRLSSSTCCWCAAAENSRCSAKNQVNSGPDTFLAKAEKTEVLLWLCHRISQAGVGDKIPQPQGKLLWKHPLLWFILLLLLLVPVRNTKLEIFCYWGKQGCFKGAKNLVQGIIFLQHISSLCLPGYALIMAEYATWYPEKALPADSLQSLHKKRRKGKEKHMTNELCFLILKWKY